MPGPRVSSRSAGAASVDLGAAAAARRDGALERRLDGVLACFVSKENGLGIVSSPGICVIPPFGVKIFCNKVRM